MARRKIENVEDAQTATEALRWLKKQKEGDIAYDDAKWITANFEDDFEYTDRYFEEDDSYAQSLLGISNWRSWQREFEGSLGKHWWTVGGGPEVLVLTRTKDGETSEGEALTALGNYPVFDENDHSDLEQETQSKDWEDYGRKEFREQIVKDSEPSDEEAIEKIVESLSDEQIDEIIYELYESSGHYPEIEGTSTIFPDVLSDWDGTLIELGEILRLDEKGYVVEAALSPAAFQRGRIVLRHQDLPEKVAGLVNNPTPIQLEYDQTVCDSPYITCRWTSEKEIAGRKEDPATGQLALPGVHERRRRRRRAS